MHECDNCGEEWVLAELAEAKDLSERVDPGGEMPSGECPDCGALCYPVDEEGDEMPEPYTGPATVTIDARKAMRLFTDWHLDDEVGRDKARDYAERLMTRLHAEAQGVK